jgi:hypothetical protein
MMMRKQLALAVAVLAAALLLVAGGGVSARSIDTTSGGDSPALLPSPSYGYKNTKPLIGVLAQPCSDCPGRYEA